MSKMEGCGIMNRSIRLLVIAIVGVTLLSTACSKTAGKAEAQAAPAPAQKQSVEAFGVIKAADKRDINIDFTATVDQVLVKEGQTVQKGDRLILLDISDYEAQISSKQHELSSIRLQVRKLQDQLKAASLENNNDPDVKKLLSDLQYSEGVYQKALKELEGQKALYDSGALSQHDYDEFVKAADEEKKAVEDIKYNLSITLDDKQKGNVEVYDDIAIQNEDAKSIESDINSLKDKLEKSYIQGNGIISDVDNGIVCEIGYLAGDKIDSSKKVLSIMNLDTMVVEANVAEEFIKDVKLGAEVEIIPTADKSKKYKGKVTRISNNAITENGETVVPVEISIDNRDGFLIPNFNVDVEIFQK